MKKMLRTVLSAILLLLTVSAPATHARPPGDIRFDKINTDFPIITFIQDRDGFFWVAGSNGLYKYDGYTFRQYVAGTGSISGNYLSALYEDSRGLIWIASSNGINVYDKATDTFATHVHDPNDPNSISNNVISVNKVQAVQEDSDGSIWIGTENGLNRFDRATQTFVRYQDQFADNDIWSLFVDREGFLWVGTVHDLHKFDPRKELVSETYQSNTEDPDALHGTHLTAILEDHEGRLWIGSRNGGLNCLPRGHHTFVHYHHDPDDDNSLSDDGITAIMDDGNGMLWISTYEGGLNLFDKKEGTFTAYRYDPANPDPEGISNNYLTDIWQDDLGVIWIGSYGGTLYRVDSGSRKFRQYRHDPKNSNSLSKCNYIGQVIEDQEGMIWITAGEGGLNRYDRQTRTFTHYHHDPEDPNSLPESYVHTIIDDKNGNLWLSSPKWFILFDKDTGKAIRKHSVKNWPDSPLRDKNHPEIIWWGSWGSGIVKFNTESGDISYFTSDPDKPEESISSNTIPYIYQDDAGMIWLCTRGGGLGKFNPRTEKVIAIHKHDANDPMSISSNALYHIYQDSARRYWVSTDRGFHRFYPETGKFQRFNKEIGNFPLSATTQIIEDDQGYLWIAGHYAGKLVRFNPDSGECKLYTSDDGLLPGTRTHLPSHSDPRWPTVVLWP